MNDPVQIIICDDHEIVLTGLQTLLGDVNNIEVIAVCNNGKELIGLSESHRPDVILLDVDMPVMNGIEAARYLKEHQPAVRIIALTVYNDMGLLRELKGIGIDGYILKNVTPQELILAIRNVHKGKSHYSAEITESLFQNLTPGNLTIPSILTSREIEIVKLVAEGLSNSAIGEKLFISHRTVDTHRTNIMKKLKVNNIAGLVKFAIQHGLVE
jgi:DNA-binding NarL/FixJ family response regulator